MRRWAVVAGLALLLSAALRTDAADAPVPDPATRARIAALRARVTEWCETRKLLRKDKCPTCQGFGVVVDMRTKRQEPCPKCEGRRLVLNAKAFRKIHYDMRSEAWRQRPTSRDEVTEAYRAADAGAERGVLAKYQVDRVELVGTRFGRGWVIEGTDTVARDSHWVAVPDPKTKKESWYLWSPDTDGAWSEETLPPPPPPVPDEAVPLIAPLAAEDFAAVRAMLEKCRTPFRLELAQRDGTTTVVSLFHPAAPDAESLDAWILKGAYPLLRGVFEAVPADERARLVFLAKWRDKFGAVTQRAYRTVEAARADFEKIHPENLTPEELLALFRCEDARYEDEVLWWK